MSLSITPAQAAILDCLAAGEIALDARVNGRAYLVIAMVPMDAPNLYERMDEVFELVGSITPVI